MESEVMNDPPDSSDDLSAQAIAWLVRVGDPDFAEWEAFEQWLAASPAHAAHYHAAAKAEAEMVAQLAATPRPQTEQPLRGRWRPAGWLGGALAASLLVAIGFSAFYPMGAPRVFETGRGDRRSIILADGSRIALNGGTRLTLDVRDGRAIELERGEALFTVRHDADHPFSVTVAGATIADVGTVFDVVREDRATHVSVAEGAVVWNPAREAVRVDAGRRLRAEDGGATIELAQVDTAAVGGWTRGRLSYDGAPLSAVAADVSRALGVRVSVAPSVAGLPVRGVVHLEGGAKVVVPRLAALFGVRAKPEGNAWRLSPPP
jgi:transmembrane sensor